jgi:hypothetical protein
MHVVVLAIWTLAAVGTLIAMFCCTLHYRRTTDCAAHFHRSAAVEMVWTAVPCVILIAGAIPAARLIWCNASLSSPMTNASAGICGTHTALRSITRAQPNAPPSEGAPTLSSIATNFGYHYH